MKRDDTSLALDDTLIRWHHWRKGYVPARGFNGKSLVVGEYCVSRQYDDVNGALDDELDHSTMGTVDFHVEELESLQKAAICTIALCLVTGACVFNNPRLPTDKEAREALFQLARGNLTRRLVAAGVL